MSDYAEWHPHLHDQYDTIMLAASNAEEAALLAGGTAASEAFLYDTRAAHKRLYAGLTPTAHPEYAGTYRGSIGTSLEKRRVGAPLFTGDGGYMFFIEPHKVAEFLNGIANTTGVIVRKDVILSADEHFQLAAKLFYTFGLVHPYLDGNGHIQRLVFATAIRLHPSLSVGPNWTIHPRPYDIEMPTAFERRPDALGAVTRELLPYVGFQSSPHS